MIEPGFLDYALCRACDATVLEDVLVEGLGLATATPLQRAICRIIDGRKLGALDTPEVRGALGLEHERACPRLAAPREVYLLSGIRAGKSLLAAAIAIRASQTCDLSRLGPGETARVSVVSLTRDLGRVVYEHLAGGVLHVPRLRSLLVAEPTADAIVLRHPSGRHVEVRVVAGARAGSSLVARWSAGAIFDEAPRMIGSEDGVVNFDDARRAVLGRLLPGAQLVAIGSPWAPLGPIYEAVCEHWGRPTAGRVVIRASGPAMNPSYWTLARIAEVRGGDEQTYRTDVLGEFAALETMLLSPDRLRACVRAHPIELAPDPAHHYVAAMDPATRGNAWSLVVVTRDRQGRVAVALARQWQGSRDAPLVPSRVLGEIATALGPYRLSYVLTDQHAADALADIARGVGLHLVERAWTSSTRTEAYAALAARIAEGTVELAPVPLLLDDLQRLRRRLTAQGSTIELPQTSDGRHCDFAPALAMALMTPCALPDAERPAPAKGWTQAEEEAAERYAVTLQTPVQRWRSWAGPGEREIAI